MNPQNALVAVTLNCNSRCVMCDIWKNRIRNELSPKEFLALPSSLRDINITGGEPFLRKDLVDIIANIKKAAPRARLVMNTNGFMPHRAKEDLPAICRMDPAFAFRVSIDGMGSAHDRIRRTPGGFNKCLQTLAIARGCGLRDLGVSFTVLDRNVSELPKVQEFCRKQNLQFSVTVATSSVIYFGTDKEALRPKNPANLKHRLDAVAHEHFHSMKPKEIIRGWFVKHLAEYIRTGKRTLPCDAGKGFFYMDSVGNVYTCHLKPWIMGNIRQQPMTEILKNSGYACKVALCNDCWMICTVKSMIQKKLFSVASRSAVDALATYL